jgi:hypothetical protein
MKTTFVSTFLLPAAALLGALLPGQGGATVMLNASTLVPGQIVISELMIDPTKVSDSNGEWFEIHNPFGVPIDLQGLVVESQTGTTLERFSIAGSAVIPAGGWFVLGRTTSTTANGGVPVDYAWGSALSFGNGADFLRVANAGGQILAQVSWSTSTAGRSLELKTATLPLLNHGSYVPGSATYGLGDFGTPGLRNTSPMTLSGLVQPGAMALSDLAAPPVPEPGTYALLAAGLGCLALGRKRLTGAR